MNAWGTLLVIALIVGGCTAIGWTLADVMEDATAEDEPPQAAAPCEAPTKTVPAPPACDEPG